MSWLDDEWFAYTRAGLTEMFSVDQSTKLQMIQFLLDEGFWDSERLSWDAAVTRFNACLNPNKRDAHFKTSELWALAKRFNRHHLFLALMQDLGYQVAVFPTEARRQELLDRIARATEACTAAVERANAELQRLPEDRGSVSKVTHFQHGRTAFSMAARGDSAP